MPLITTAAVVILTIAVVVAVVIVMVRMRVLLSTITILLLVAAAVKAVLAQGLRTADIYSPGTTRVSTLEMGAAVVKAL